MTDAIDGHFTFLRPVRAPYCNVLVARQFQENGKPKGEPKFDLTVIIKADDIGDVIAKMKLVAGTKWPGVPMSELKFPVKSAQDFVASAVKNATKKGQDATKAKEKAESILPKDYATVKYYILKAASKFPVTVSRFVKGVPTAFAVSDQTEAKQKVFGGCWLAPIVNFVPYVGKKEDEKNGVTAYLDQVLIVDTPKGEEGGRLGSAVQDPRDAFKGYAGAISAEDPTGGADLDDEIPF